MFDYNQYKKSIYKNNDKIFFPLIFLVIILLLGLAIFLRPQANIYVEYYFVELGSFESYKSANEYALSIQENGGAGYIYYDEKYHVFASFYSTYGDADTVTKNLKNDYPKTNIFTLQVLNLNKKSNIDDAIKNIFLAQTKLIQDMENIALDFDKNEITFAQAKIMLESSHKTYLESHDAFISSYKHEKKYNVHKGYLLDISTALDSLLSCVENNLSTTLRFTIIDITLNHFRFSSLF